MKQIFDLIGIILNFSFPIPFNFLTGETLNVSIFGIIVVLICISFASYIIYKLTK